MELFGFTLLLLGAIFLSNIINRFLPTLSVPIVQILLGAVIAILPFGFHIELDPRLFFVLFIAPLVFDNSVHIDKAAFWKLKGPIMSMAFGLVLVSTFAGGFLVNALIPAIPVAAGCALIASLGPTDDVAIFSLSKYMKLPDKLKNILEGECVFSDVSGIVSFQFAIVAVMTGTFSPVRAAGQFVIVAAGGIAVGLAFTGVKYLFVRWIRSLGIENVVLNILLEILTPFLVYLAADAAGYSAVLAVSTAGILHSLARNKLSPDNVRLKNTSESVWEILSFTLNGLVFLLMGTQLPAIIGTIANDNFPIPTWQIILYVFVIMFFFIVIRFLWSLLIHKKTYSEEGQPMGKLKAGVIVCLSGARGADTMACILSIPVLLDNGTLFPQRDLLILISVCIIIISLVLSDFVLPFTLGKGKTENDILDESEAYIEILQGVAAALQAQSTPENLYTVGHVTRDYYRRINTLQNGRHLNKDERGQEHTIRLQTIVWESENTRAKAEAGEIDAVIANRYLNLLDAIAQRENGKKLGLIKTLASYLHHMKHFFNFGNRSDAGRKTAGAFHKLKSSNDHYVLEKLKGLSGGEENPAVKKAIAEYELSLSIDEAIQAGGIREGANGRHPSKESMNEILAHAFQLERDGVQSMFEKGRISREFAKEMRNNITVLEMELAKDAV